MPLAYKSPGKRESPRFLNHAIFPILLLQLLIYHKVYTTYSTVSTASEGDNPRWHHIFSRPSAMSFLSLFQGTIESSISRIQWPLATRLIQGGLKILEIPSRGKHFLHLKIRGWFKWSFLLGGKDLFSGAFAISFRVSIWVSWNDVMLKWSMQQDQWNPHPVTPRDHGITGSPWDHWPRKHGRVVGQPPCMIWRSIGDKLMNHSWLFTGKTSTKPFVKQCEIKCCFFQKRL